MTGSAFRTVRGAGTESASASSACQSRAEWLALARRIELPPTASGFWRRLGRGAGDSLGELGSRWRTYTVAGASLRERAAGGRFGARGRSVKRAA